MDNSKVIDIVLEYLRNKQNLTDLEKDILSSLNKLNEKPFDRSGTEQKLIENNLSMKICLFRCNWEMKRTCCLLHSLVMMKFGITYIYKFWGFA